MLFIRSLGSGLHLRCLRFPSIVSGMPSRWGRFKACSAGAGASGNAGDGQGQSANPSASANPSGVGASGIANDGSGSANPLPFHCTQDTRDSLINYMESCHKGLWHWTLNNTTSTRPKDNGGPTVPSVTKCKAHTQPGPASTSWECVLELPNSFAKDDGIRLRVSAEAPTKDEADEHACRLAFLHLLTERPGDVILRPAHWNVSRNELIENMPYSLPAHQALPVHVNRNRGRMAGESATERYSHDPKEWEGRVVALLNEIITCHKGSFDPSWISHKQMGRRRQDPRAYEELNKLLKPNELKEFVEGHPDFAWAPTKQNYWKIQWAT